MQSTSLIATGSPPHSPRFPPPHPRRATPARRGELDLASAWTAVLVSDERLEPADGDGQRLLADDAVAFAEPLLGTEAAAHIGQVARLVEDLGGALHVALLQLPERAGDVVIGGAGLDAGRSRTLDAAHRLHLGHLHIDRQVDLVPVVDANLRVLFWQMLARNLEARPPIDVQVSPIGHDSSFQQ